MKKLVSLGLTLSLLACSDDKSSKGQETVAIKGNDAPSVPAGDTAGTTTPAAVEPQPSTTPLVTIENGELALNFAAKVQGEKIACYDKSAAMKSAGQIFTDVRIFVSNIALVNDQGETVKLALNVSEASSNLQFADANGNSIALLNYLDASCASSDATKTLKEAITGLLPYGHYKALTFQVGLPYPSMDPALTKIPAALAPTDMAWMWEHFPADFQIETNDGTGKKILNSLTSATKTTVTLALDFNHAKDAKAPVVDLELSKLFVTTAEAFISGLEKTCVNSNKAMTEASPNCSNAYKAFGLPIQNASSAYEQSLFSIAP